MATGMYTSPERVIRDGKLVAFAGETMTKDEAAQRGLVPSDSDAEQKGAIDPATEPGQDPEQKDDETPATEPEKDAAPKKKPASSGRKSSK